MTTRKRRQSSDAMRVVRPVLEERCQGLCEKCGLPLRRDDAGRYVFEAHHRKARSAGGTDDAWNLLCTHPMCHNQHRHSIHDNPGYSKDMGWIVPVWENPLHTRVLYMGHWAWLLLDGSVQYEAGAA